VLSLCYLPRPGTAGSPVRSTVGFWAVLCPLRASGHGPSRVRWQVRQAPGLYFFCRTQRKELRWRRDALLLCAKVGAVVPAADPTAWSQHDRWCPPLPPNPPDSGWQDGIPWALPNPFRSGPGRWDGKVCAEESLGRGGRGGDVQGPRRGAAQGSSAPAPPSPPLPLRNLGAPPFY
jgi:hypothetical protein